jgi:DNA repair exonuclease SbcCD nuclease subunit
MKKKNIFICGDIHGELKKLVWELTIKNDLKDISLIVVGDFGVGFGGHNSMKVLYDKVKKRLETNNINLYTIRGNHDDPSWFDGTHNFPRLKFLEDHKLITIDGWSIYPVGGATSIDREERIKINEKLESKNNNRRCWWPNENIVVADKLPVKAEVILTHESPISFDPVIYRSDDMSLDIYKDVLKDRNYLATIIEEVNFDYWFYGHYHTGYSGNIGDRLYRCLGIDEIFELRCKED